MITWGPAVLVCVTVVIGVLFNNYRISDLRSHVGKRFDDMKDWAKSEIRRLEERQSPIVHS